MVAEAEIALASRDLGWPMQPLDAAQTLLEARGDRMNAAHARHIGIRRLLLVGRIDEAECRLATLDPRSLAPASRAVHRLVAAGIALRRLRARDARIALSAAGRAARAAAIPALVAEVERARVELDAPAARVVTQGRERALRLEDVESLIGSQALIVDACRHSVRAGGTAVALASRPILFALARALGEAWPGDVAREALVARLFRLALGDDSHRARLRVEIGRLRALVRGLADIRATPRGFALVPTRADAVIVLLRPIEEAHAAVLAFLADGEAWSSSALALALGTSQRSVQRALDSLAGRGKVQSYGRGRARRWITPPIPGFATTLLLPAPLPGD